MSRPRAAGQTSSRACLQLRGGPLRMLAQQLVLGFEVRLEGLGRAVRRAAVAERDERVPTKVTRIVPRDEEAVELAHQLVPVAFEPFDERDVRSRVFRRLRAGSPLLDAAVPRADVLAD